MNKNINLVKILKNVPGGTKLYSPIAGDLTFMYVDDEACTYPIVCKTNSNYIVKFTSNGLCNVAFKEGECVLFPSKDQRDWNEFITNFITFYIGDTIVVDLNGTKRLAVYKGYNKANQKYKVLCLGWRRETYVNVEQIKKYEIKL